MQGYTMRCLTQITRLADFPLTLRSTYAVKSVYVEVHTGRTLCTISYYCMANCMSCICRSLPSVTLIATRSFANNKTSTGPHGGSAVTPISAVLKRLLWMRNKAEYAVMMSTYAPACSRTEKLCLALCRALPIQAKTTLHHKAQWSRAWRCAIILGSMRC